MSYGRLNFDYTQADNPNFSLKEGESFVITSADSGNGWTKILTSGGDAGYVPSNYFSPISGQEYEAENSNDNLYEEVNYEDIRSQQSAVDGQEHVKVIYEYKAADGSISVNAGETHVLLDKSNSQWWKIETPQKQVGFVPANYVEEVDSLYEAVPSGPPQMPKVGIGKYASGGSVKPNHKGSIPSATPAAAPKAPKAPGIGRPAETSNTGAGKLFGMSPTERRRREEAQYAAAQQAPRDPLEPVPETTPKSPPTPVYAEPHDTIQSYNASVSSNSNSDMYTADTHDARDADVDVTDLRRELSEAETQLQRLLSEKNDLESKLVQASSSSIRPGEMNDLLSRITTIQQAAKVR